MFRSDKMFTKSHMPGVLDWFSPGPYRARIMSIRSALMTTGSVNQTGFSGTGKPESRSAAAGLQAMWQHDLYHLLMIGFR